MGIKTLNNYIECMKLYNESVENQEVRYKFNTYENIGDLSKEDVINMYFNTDGDAGFKIIKLEKEEESIKKFISKWMFEGVNSKISYIEKYIKDNNVKKNIKKYFNYDYYSVRDYLNNADYSYNPLSEKILKIINEYYNFEKYNTYRVKYKIDFFYELYGECILIECGNKYLILHFYFTS